MELKNKSFYGGILLFIIILCVIMYLYKNDTTITNGIWLILCVGGLIYYALAEFVVFFYKIVRKLRVKEIRKTYVKMEIIGKYFTEGHIKSIQGTRTKMPNSYIMDLEYNGNKYRINDEEIFQSSEVGDYINLKLIEKLDKEQNIISYKLDNIETKSNIDSAE